MPTHVARQRFAAVVEDVGFHGRRIVVTAHGRDRCALVSMADLAKLEAIEAKQKPARSRRQ